MKQKLAICWFRQDLRLADNPAWFAAASHAHVLPIYILDDVNAGDYAPGAASRWWLHHSLHALDQTLGHKLGLYRGDPWKILEDLLERFDVEAVYWNRLYEPWSIQRDKAIKLALEQRGIPVKTSNGSLLWEPWTVTQGPHVPYRVFTPFYRKGCLRSAPPREVLPTPGQIAGVVDEHSVTLEELQLLPTGYRWDKALAAHWQISEQAAHACLEDFLAKRVGFYKEGRNFPAKPYVSRLSPYLRFGQLSAHQIWHRVGQLEKDKNIDHFCSELGWREFSYHQLFFHQDLPWRNMQSKFDAYPWVHDQAMLRLWQKGMTGYPLVDAGMRELWQTGYMHNRLRMIVGSFLVKNLMVHWVWGERWFWDTLVDADLANNSASWQWVAGCGSDSAPYFRIFNPITQGLKFDPNGDYVRKYVPEIAALPTAYLFSPWEAPASVLQEAGIELGKTYPQPMVDLNQSRDKALAAFEALKGEGA